MRGGLFRRGAFGLALATTLAALPAGAGWAAPEGLDRFYRQQLDWKPCANKALDDAGGQCAGVTVPVDYRAPNGPTMVVAISRLKATDRSRRRGVILSNPGGPGATGLAMMVNVRSRLTPDVRARYDLIGMDPRGVGRSAPVDCGMRVPTVLTSAGFDLASFGRDAALKAAFAAACRTREGDRIRHLTTRNTARDLDVIRGALGEQRINYYGVSGGTYLGSVFIQLFPQRSDRMVFDSAIDPDRYWLGTVQDMGPVNEAALDDWAGWAAAHDSEYRLGATAPQVRALVEDLMRRIAARPIPYDGYALNEELGPMVLFAMLTNPTANELLSVAVRNLADTAIDGKPFALDRRIPAFLAAQQAAAGGSMAAITCGDVAQPREPAWYWRNIEAARAAQPVFGAFANNIQPCAFWPEPLEPPTVVRNSVPVLILQATRDSRTAYPEGLALHRDLTGSRLITLQDVRIHGAFRLGLSTCVNDAVNRYFRDGAMPAADLTCRKDG